MGRHAERTRLPFNDFCRGCWSAEEEETVIQFLCQCPSLIKCKFRLFCSPFLVSLTKLSSIDIKTLTSFRKLSCFWLAALVLINFSFFVCFEKLGQYRAVPQLWNQRSAIRAQVNFMISKQLLRPTLILRQKHDNYRTVVWCMQIWILWVLTRIWHSISRHIIRHDVIGHDQFSLFLWPFLHLSYV